MTDHEMTCNRAQAIYDSVTEALRTTYWCWTYHTEDESPGTLRMALTRNLPHIDVTSWDERFDFGGVYINGQPAYRDQTLPVPCRIEYYEPKFEISQAHTIFPAFKDEYVIFRDEHILVAYKPPALSSMPAKEQRHYSLKNYLEKLTGSSVHMPSRLDVSAQGIVITSISPLAHANLQRSFEHRRVEKTYLCASSSLAPWEEKIVTAPIGRDPLHPVLRTTRVADGQEAETHFHRLCQGVSEGQTIHVYSAKPVTGRTHQIRVHAASEGMALKGDRFYGGAPASHLHLVSHSITCEHPVSRKICTFILPSVLQPEWAKDTSEKCKLPPRAT
jgi:23S rRNA-/tRNA-specific pseudouridylate synthase